MAQELTRFDDWLQVELADAREGHELNDDDFDVDTPGEEFQRRLRRRMSGDDPSLTSSVFASKTISTKL